MSAFLIGLGVAIAIGAGALLSLQFVDRSTSQAFYTRDTVPLNCSTPAGGRLVPSQDWWESEVALSPA